ncbi:WYL domain-containing protein [Paenibacillus tyrfis]|uniref:WYL domain-containing protein n=1 Tax=Paenibacillus tyrfis TaxID=1501230 RepID=UPI00209EEA6D|nr:WYL domain-containing protein [Paenibacillus tyrfis]MCP1307656.1 WYL domain-containing protein [Paenibacillus tyrfis]
MPASRACSILKELLEAALEQRVVTIAYEAASRRERMIQPLGLYTMNGLWYCQAYCFLAEDYRVFRVDRVKDFSHEADQSRRLDTTEEHIQTWILRTDESEALELEVDLTPEGVRRCQSDLWLSQSVKLREDGSGTIRTMMSASYAPWAVHFFLGFGTEANVKHPSAVREQIQSKLREMLNQYADSK